MSEDAAAKDTSNVGEWWRFGDDPAATTSWRPAGMSILDGLLDVVPNPDAADVADSDAEDGQSGEDGGEVAPPRPWLAGHELHIQGCGGLVSKERRHYTIVGNGVYSNTIGGCRTLTADSQTIYTTDDLVTNIAKGDIADDSPLASKSISWGTDALNVSGDANMTWGSRTTMMSGLVHHNYNGGVMKIASMEGIICGGAMLRLIASPSVTLSLLGTGDVYGGIARCAVVRSYLAVLHYRAAAACVWLTGAYQRLATFVIEPIIGIPQPNQPQGKIMEKLSRLMKPIRAIATVCPPLDILIGILSIPFGIYGLFKMFANWVKKPPPIPPTGPPRVRVRTAPLLSQMASSELVI